MYFEDRTGDLDAMKFLKPAGKIEGAKVGWERMARELGSDDPVWL